MLPPRPSRLRPQPRPWRLRVRPLLTCGSSVPSSAASCSRNGDQGPDPRAALAIARVDGVHTAVLVPGATRGPHGSRPAGRDSAPGWASWARRGRGATSARNSALSPALPIALTPASLGHPARDGSELSWKRDFTNGGPYGECTTCQVLYQVLYIHH